MAGVEKGMEYTADFESIISIPRFAKPYDVSHVAKAETWESFLACGADHPDPPFERIAFHEPFLVYYSSGTTGTPKAIVHSVGGCIVNFFKEGRLHECTTSETVALQYTTTGWIMYLAAVGALLFGARVVLYDGSPFQPDLKTFIRIMGQQKITKLGTSPRWMFEVAKNGISPREVADLSSLKIVTSTGMVLSDQLFEWFYDEGFPPTVQLANISGGTDIAGCFGMENPLEPVFVGGTQGPSLGVAVSIYDSSLPDGPGQPVPDGVPGELVATQAFPNVPCFLWGDSSPSDAPGPRYRSSYFSRFNRVWVQGDFCEVHPLTGNIAFLGRADGVLNPSGIRFGSAEIYAVIERNFSDKIMDSLCVGRRRKKDTDESVMLFLLMKPGVPFTAELKQQVKNQVAKELTKRHVPRFMFETPEIPVSGNDPSYDRTNRLLFVLRQDNRQFEEGGVAGQEDCVGVSGDGERHAVEPPESGVLLSVCGCGRRDCAEGEALIGRRCRF
jgi:acetoacetyl-CoA synthetase